MENAETKIIQIYSGKRSWYELVLAAVFYSITTFIFILILYYLTLEINYKESLIKLFEFFYYGLPCLANGLIFSMIKDIEIDTKNNSIHTLYKVGPFIKKVKTKAQEFEYVSVFLTDKNVFETNLWYVRNKHYKMYEFEKKEDAFEFGEMVADKLNIDLLDATERGNNKWVEKK
ncbi:hypothetical protein [Flavobacterium capsici]|uniref:Uncharacterized protein n=1 Tax=Flavobacterium capsici TaxID=3075618 RepID=A0AA96J347_9FLAO|nr:MULTISPECIES: hypothetical protein [unclassified Flavobacterium]WNM19800.1 hypothetical protein RN608_03750 [Flavobacterium sp. PMR2A8]WNM21189.1 hypothetical protein RN605_10920 [Flavobacterium sp. PMTSA4]